MKKSTIVRTILLAVVIINMALEKMGYNIIKVDESEVANLVEYAIEIAIIVIAWWKNNSFTANAIKSDEYLAKLRAMEEE